MTSKNNPQFTIETRPVNLPQSERARRLAAVYDLLLEKSQQARADGDAADQVPVTAVSSQGAAQ
jgi:hypothetical protein